MPNLYPYYSHSRKVIYGLLITHIYMLSSMIGYMNANHVHKKENSIIFMRLIS